MLYQEAEPFLWLPDPFILIALLNLPAALLPVNGGLLKLMETEGYKTHGYKTNYNTSCFGGWAHTATLSFLYLAWHIESHCLRQGLG